MLLAHHNINSKLESGKKTEKKMGMLMKLSCKKRLNFCFLEIWRDMELQTSPTITANYWNFLITKWLIMVQAQTETKRTGSKQ